MDKLPMKKPEKTTNNDIHRDQTIPKTVHRPGYSESSYLNHLQTFSNPLKALRNAVQRNQELQAEQNLASSHHSETPHYLDHQQEAEAIEKLRGTRHCATLLK